LALCVVLVGCGGGGHQAGIPENPGFPDNPGGSDNAEPGQGNLRVYIDLGGASRAIPEVEEVELTLIGGVDVKKGWVGPAGGSVAWSVAPGQYTLLAAARGYQTSSSRQWQAPVVGLNAVNAAVEAGRTTTVTLSIPLDRPTGILQAQFTGTKVIDGQTVQVLLYEDGREEYYSNDRQAPQSGIPNVRFHGYKKAGEAAPTTWNPPILLVPNEPPEAGQALTQAVTQTNPDGSAESVTAKVTFEGYDGLIPTSRTESVSGDQAARLLVSVGNLIFRAWFDPLGFDYYQESGFGGPALVTYLDAEGKVTKILWWLFGYYQKPYPSRQAHPYFPLEEGRILTYLASEVVGGEVVVDVTVPFGVTGRAATTNPLDAARIRFSRPVIDPEASTHPALDPANYTLTLNPETAQATSVPVTNVLLEDGSDRDVVLQVAPDTSLPEKATYLVEVNASVTDAEGKPFGDSAAYRTLSGKLGPDGFRPFPVSAEWKGQELWVTFMEELDPDSLHPEGRWWVETPEGPEWPQSLNARLEADRNGKKTIVVIGPPEGECIEVPSFVLHTDGGVADLNGNPSMGTVSAEGLDTCPPRVKQAWGQRDRSSTKLFVRWSEAVNPNDATNKLDDGVSAADLYELESPHGQAVDLAGASFEYDAESHVTTISGIKLADRFKLRVRQIRDLVGNRMDWQTVEGSVQDVSGYYIECQVTTDRAWIKFSYWINGDDAENRLNYMIEHRAKADDPWAELPTKDVAFVYDYSTQTVLLFGLTFQAGELYRITLRNFGWGVPEDGVNNVCEGTVAASVDDLVLEEEPPRLVQWNAWRDSEGARIELLWNEMIEPADAQNRSLYELESPHGQPVSLAAAEIKYLLRERKVIISNVELGGDFKLRVSNVRDLAGNRLDWQTVEGSVWGGSDAGRSLSWCLATEDRVWVEFSDYVWDRGRVENPLNWRLESDGAVVPITGPLFFDSDTNVLVMRGVDLTVGKPFQLTARNLGGIVDEDGTNNVCGGDVQANVFRLQSCTATAGTADTGDAVNNKVTATFSANADAGDATNSGKFEFYLPIGSRWWWLGAFAYADSTTTIEWSPWDSPFEVGKSFRVVVRDIRNADGSQRIPVDFCDGAVVAPPTP